MKKVILEETIKTLAITFTGFLLNLAQCRLEMAEYKQNESAFGTAFGTDVFYAALLILPILLIAALLTIRLRALFRLILLAILYLLSAIWANCAVFEARVAPWNHFTYKETLLYVAGYHNAFPLLGAAIYYVALRLLFRYIFEKTDAAV
ncbi:MAG: hypothetical protein LBQ96_02555 [Fusobacteriaceae bacterium]|jgi:hypothetical protein|nr:hypothetical protein [Fusobacteriaceae bacterium]